MQIPSYHHHARIRKQDSESLRRKIILVAELKHSSGLSCYPDAKCVAGRKEQDLHQAGFSQTKSQTLITLSQRILENRLPLDSWVIDMPPVDEIHEQPLRICEIGLWTINYALLHCCTASAGWDVA